MFHGITFSHAKFTTQSGQGMTLFFDLVPIDLRAAARAVLTKLAQSATMILTIKLSKKQKKIDLHCLGNIHAGTLLSQQMVHI